MAEIINFPRQQTPEQLRREKETKESLIADITLLLSVFKGEEKEFELRKLQSVIQENVSNSRLEAFKDSLIQTITSRVNSAEKNENLKTVKPDHVIS